MIRKTPEIVFSDLNSKDIEITLKDQTVIRGKYEKTLCFNDGELAIHTCIYFQLNFYGQIIFVSGSDVEIIKASTETGL